MEVSRSPRTSRWMSRASRRALTKFQSFSRPATNLAAHRSCGSRHQPVIRGSIPCSPLSPMRFCRKENCHAPPGSTTTLGNWMNPGTSSGFLNYKRRHVGQLPLPSNVTASISIKPYCRAFDGASDVAPDRTRYSNSPRYWVLAFIA